MDLIREVLLAVEAHSKPYEMMQDLKVPGFEDLSVNYHVELLNNAGLLIAHERQAIGLYEWYPIALTWTGHDFLDSVRDPEMWKKTKDGALQAGGWTFDLLKDLAKGLAKKKIEDLTGVKL